MRPADPVLRERDARVEGLLARFRAFPYENASKIVARRRRSPEEMRRDHRLHGAGGTCFDLVNLFHRMARQAGLEPRLALADRSYGPNTHCAVIVRDELCDPGYMQFQPVPLRDEPIEVDTPHNRLRVAPRAHGWDVFTIDPPPPTHEPGATCGLRRAGGGPPSPTHDRAEACGLRRAGRATFRYHLKDARVSGDEFIDAWEQSFEFEMMNHLVTIVARADRLIYLRDGHYHEFSRAGRVRREVPPESACELGLSRELVGRALACLR